MFKLHAIIRLITKLTLIFLGVYKRNGGGEHDLLQKVSPKTKPTLRSWILRWKL